MKVSKLFSDKQIKQLSKQLSSADHLQYALHGRKTGHTSGHVFEVIGKAMQAPHKRHFLCDNQSKYILTLAEHWIVKTEILHLNIIRDKDRFFLKYDIFKEIDLKEIK